MRLFIFRILLWLTKLLPTRVQARYWSRPCPVCAIERDWHEFGSMPGVVFIDGMGSVPCDEVRYRLD